jgi:hypothetical protein
VALGARPLLALYALVTAGAYGYLAFSDGDESFPRVYGALALSLVLAFLVLCRSRLAWLALTLFDAAWVIAYSAGFGEARTLTLFVLKALALGLLLSPPVRAHVWHRPRRHPRLLLH